MHTRPLLIVLLLAVSGSGHAQTGKTLTPLGAAPRGSAIEPASPAKRDPFARLRQVLAMDRLGPQYTVRPRNGEEGEDPKKRKQVRVVVRTSPSGARVYHRGRSMGSTPLTVPGGPKATPMDLVIKAGGTMVLRTRIQRRKSRTYVFKLTPAKLR